ncbi:Holliday junction branch migration protein RuvA [Aquaspirillum serpens]|uniref:Holliday junction branch migration protein RuvA n=1 Tax=Aquaspirillum serpens TaxID=190 RepID=UPI0003B5820A|nr:Holliday junction branch migration protein RuvA [Aquaspirillum serpens]
MIGRLHGVLLEKHAPQIVLDVQGVGYEIDVPLRCFEQLPALGEVVTLHTHLVIREDAHLLFGFLTAAERATFRQLIKVSGIGAKMALAILSTLSQQELAQALATDDVKRLSSVPGVGKKTAERLILELRGKLTSADTIPTSLLASAHSDIVQALIALGYQEKPAMAVVETLPADIEVGTGIRLALKQLAKL